MIVLAIQAPAPPPEGPSPPLPARGDGPVALPLPPVPAFVAFLEGERQYAERLSVVLDRDLKREWADYEEDERESAQERAEGDDDEDDAAMTFGAYLDEKYRSRRKLGIMLFSVGFAPLGVGLGLGLTLGEGPEVLLGIAGVGGALIVSGAVLFGVRQAQLRRFRDAHLSMSGGRRARLQWRGVAPTYDPYRGTHGVTLGFAF
nr:hypothetical protein [Nannocystis sp.]